MGLKATILMTCRDATAVVEKKRDGKLNRLERMGLWIHLLYCGLCKAFFAQSEVVDKSYTYYAGTIDLGKTIHPLDPAKKEALQTAFRQELEK